MARRGRAQLLSLLGVQEGFSQTPKLPVAEAILFCKSVSEAVGNPKITAKFMTMLPNFAVALTSIAEYAEHLEDAFLFSEARRWDVKGKRYFDYPLKYYCEDPGLRNARLDFRDVEPSHMMENVIFNELAARGCQVDVGVVPIAGRQHEIDFVVNRAPGKLYIQVALELPNEEKRRQELLPLRKSDDFFRKMLIVRGYDPPRFTGDGIIEVGVIPFLLDPAILDKALSDDWRAL